MAAHTRGYRTTLKNFHLPVDLVDRLTEESRVTGKPHVKIVIEALEKRLSKPFVAEQGHSAHPIELDGDL
jgi:hypothetical protein